MAIITVTATQIRLKFSNYLKQAQNGDTIVVTKHGKALVTLSPPTVEVVAQTSTATAKSENVTETPVVNP